MLLDLLQARRSVRQYRSDDIDAQSLQTILQAGLLYPSSAARYPVSLIVVRDKEMLEKLSQCKPGGAGMLKDANAAIVVIGDSQKSDCWIEDCSIVMTLMHLQAQELQIGSCWVQCRNRANADAVLRDLLEYPAAFQAEAILSLGLPKESVKGHCLPVLEGVHFETYGNE